MRGRGYETRPFRYYIYKDTTIASSFLKDAVPAVHPKKIVKGQNIERAEEREGFDEASLATGKKAGPLQSSAEASNAIARRSQAGSKTPRD
jgi:hypothetical protein